MTRPALDPFKLPVFPAADVFPMMGDDELAELAADIKEHGLRDPIVVGEVPDGDGVVNEALIDGRNRREACKIVGVVPEIRHLTDEDPTAFVLSANIHRRNLTAGQRAMAVAMIHPEPEKGGRGKKVTEAVGFSTQRLSYARTVLKSSPESADAVLSGEMSLDAAYQQVRMMHGSARNERSRLTKLRETRPDLADLVVNDAMKLDDAIANAAEEADARKQQRWAMTMEILDGIRPFDRLPETAEENMAFYDPAVAESRGETITPARLRRAGAYINCLADALENTE